MHDMRRPIYPRTHGARLGHNERCRRETDSRENNPSMAPVSEHRRKADFDALFTRDRHVIFVFHSDPWLIHRLTYRRTNHDNIHVRGYKEEGTITTAFDLTVRNDLDRFHLMMNTIDRLPQTGERGLALKRRLQDKLIERKRYTRAHGQDMPEIRDWQWKAAH